MDTDLAIGVLSLIGAGFGGIAILKSASLAQARAALATAEARIEWRDTQIAALRAERNAGLSVRVGSVTLGEVLTTDDHPDVVDLSARRDRRADVAQQSGPKGGDAA